MKTNLFVELENNEPVGLLIERMVGQTKVFHRILPVGEETTITSQIPPGFIEWIVARFEERLSTLKEV